MSDLTQLHADLREQNKSIKELTGELSKHNSILVEVISDNKHRDARIEDCETQIGIVKGDIDAIHKQRTEDREEYKHSWDRSKDEQSKKDGWINNLQWFLLVAVLILVTNGISSGYIKTWFTGNAKPQQEQK